MENETIQTPEIQAVAEAQPSAAEAPKTIEVPVKNDETDKRMAGMVSEIAALKEELQRSNIKSALAERRLIPHDAELVSRMVMDKISNGANPDEACAALYKSHPYLFKNISIQNTADAEKAAKAADEARQNDLNKRLVESAIQRLRRDKVTL